MTADTIDYRLEKYAAMGFDHLQSLILANTRESDGVPLYWCKVQEIVSAIGLVAAYDLLT